MESTKTKSRKKNKSKGQKRILLCFKPTTLDDSFEEKSPRNRADPVLTCFAVAEEESRIVLPTILSSALSSEDCTVDGSRRNKNADHRSFWQALKAAFAKKVTKKKAATQKLCSTSSESRKVSTFDVDDKTRQTNSIASSGFRCSSAFTPSSLSSTISTPISSSRTLGSSSHSTELSRTSSTSLLSSANTELIGFDFVWQILCYTLHFDLALCGASPEFAMQPAGFKEMSKLDSVQYKKKIIMEGCLRGDIAV
ncbi:hypothetical protein L6164_022517 [Bauhinia variegata]|uniref:Uncharacterized protein n=1 Tax=Bauhinia variegata TaxID=167791 RepID=A0ACB9MFW9_BAUVA|nr:hypothetical protein L6164_022517 [Bauhinia variegata]